MEWVNVMRLHVLSDLEAAQVEEKARDIELALAASAADVATTRVADLERVLYSLDQLNPGTRDPQVPL